MAFFGEYFDIDSVPESNNYDVIPAGWYESVITRADLKDTKDGSGMYLSVRFDIIGPTHQGRVVFANLNIKNKSTQAEEIGRKALADLVRAIGLSKATDTDQLINGQLSIKITEKPEFKDAKTGQIYEASNEVKGYKPISVVSGLSSTVPASVITPNATSSPQKMTPPWGKR